ncbi:MAG: LacI family DNA-binding transcriptional regulator [Anaerolineales bacterium]
MPRSRITIRDVANHAGVSHQTVSRVINNSERVRPETRTCVEAAIKELGYRPNAIARSMARGHTCTLACISPNLTDYTFANIIEGAEAEVRKHGYFLVTSSAPTEEDFSRLIEELFTSSRAEGLLVINPYADNRHKLLPSEAPTIFISQHREQETVGSVALDDLNAARKATQHLIDLNHKRIALVTGPMEEDCSQDRCAGYKEALQENGITFDPALTITGDWTATSGYLALQKLLTGAIIPSAIFAQNDRMAIGVLRAARENGIPVPEELSVIGIDDMPLSSYFDPPLTTMRQDTLSIGREAARLLIDTLEKREMSPKQILLQAQLVKRESTGLLSTTT